VEVYLFTRSK